MRRFADPQTHSQRLRVLLLEDSKLDATIIAAELEQSEVPFEIVRVVTREDFLQALRGSDFDLILSDYNVPGFEGEEALALALEHCPQSPFLFVSGALGEHTAIDLLKRGATDYVLKDRLERLLPSVQRALRENREKLERIRAEETLRERERTLSTLIGNLPGMAFRREPRPPWSLSFASEGCTELTGHPPESFYATGGLTWGDVLADEDVERFATEAEAAFRERKQLTTVYRIRTRSGEERWVWERSVAQYRADGSLESVEGFASDITQQKVAEQELRRRVEFEQQLIGIVSHDLRNPLNAITLGASVLLKREGLNEASTTSVRRILASAERAGRMIRDLLDFTQARLGEGLPISPREVELHSLAGQVVDEFEHSQPEREIILASCESQQTRGAWDPDRIAQALTNLVANALAYSPKDTPVTIRCFADGTHGGFEVHNFGTPIAPARIPQIFKPLSRGVDGMSLQTRSIGLGLFIVESIARAHRGSVTVRSNEQEGTTFCLSLPRYP